MMKEKTLEQFQAEWNMHVGAMRMVLTNNRDIGGE